MLKIAIALVLLALMFGGGFTAPKGPTFGAIDEKTRVYKGYTISVALVGDSATPWRATILDGKGNAVTNAIMWSASEAEAFRAGELFVDAMPDWLRNDFPPAAEPATPEGPIVEPPKPPVPTPTPTKEGGGEPPQPIACETRLRDGQYTVCLYPSGNGRYAYRAQDGSGMDVATEGGFATKNDAKVSAWRLLASMPTAVTSSTRHGVRVNADATLELVDQAAYLARAVPVLTAELARGERDPRGLVLAIFGAFWPSYNPLRFRYQGRTLAEVAARIEPFIPNAQMVALNVWQS